MLALDCFFGMLTLFMIASGIVLFMITWFILSCVLTIRAFYNESQVGMLNLLGFSCMRSREMMLVLFVEWCCWVSFVAGINLAASSATVVLSWYFVIVFLSMLFIFEYQPRCFFRTPNEGIAFHFLTQRNLLFFLFLLFLFLLFLLLLCAPPRPSGKHFIW